MTYVQLTHWYNGDQYFYFNISNLQWVLKYTFQLNKKCRTTSVLVTKIDWNNINVLQLNKLVVIQATLYVLLMNSFCSHIVYDKIETNGQTVILAL